MSNISLTDIRKSKSFQIFQTLLCFGILAAVLTFCFSLLKYSFYPVDEPYQIMNSMDYLNSPLAPLTAILDHFTNSLCGYDMLSAKYVGFLYMVLTIALSCTFFYNRTKRICISVLMCAILILLTTWYFNTAMLIGWDRQTMFFTTIVILLFIKYVETNKIAYLIATAFATCITTLCRIPSIAIIPILFIIILINKNLNIQTRIKHAFIYAISAIIFIFAFIIIMYGSIGNYACYIKANLISNHGIYGLTIYYFVHFVTTMFPLCAVYCTYKVLTMIQHHIYAVFLFAVFAIIAFIYDMRINPISHNSLRLINATIMLLEFVAIYKFYKESKTKELIIILAVFFVSFTPLLGSNTGLQKFLSYSVFPIILCLLKPIINKSFIITSGIIVVSSLSMISITMINGGGVVIRTSITESTLEFDFHPIKGIRVNPEWGSTINKIRQDIEDFKDDKILVVGTYSDRYFLEWIYNSRNEYLSHDFENSNKFNEYQYVDYISNKIKDSKENITVLYLYEKYFWEESNNPYESKMSQMLESNMDLAIKKDKYAIFISKKN